MHDPTSTDEADAQGYTRQIVIEGDGYPIGLDAFIKRDADTDGVFRAFDSDHQRMVTLDGSKVSGRDAD